MKRLSFEEKKKVASILPHPDRPLQILQEKQFSRLAARQRREEAVRLANTTAMYRVLFFIQSLAVRAGMH